MKVISLTSWLETTTTQTILADSHPVFIFQGGAEYPILFFTLFHARLREKSIPIQQMDVTTSEWSSVEGLISTSFLGQSLVYHLRGVDALESKKLKRALPFILNYQGTHRLIVWLADAVSSEDSQALVIKMPDKVDATLMVVLAQSLGFNRVATNSRFLKMIFTKSNSISLELACLLCSYGSVIGNDLQEFNTQWLDLLLDIPPSLFTMSQHFFNRDAKTFGHLWQRLKDVYPFPFWTTFWSEQLFRAACVIRYNQLQQFQQAKKISFRLPFTFTTSGWRQYSYQELIQAHAALYEHDGHMKNGGSPEMLELFYAQFFARKFKTSCEQKIF